MGISVAEVEIGMAVKVVFGRFCSRPREPIAHLVHYLHESRRIGRCDDGEPVGAMKSSVLKS